eukprot:gene9008-biopygen5750
MWSRRLPPQSQPLPVFAARRGRLGGPAGAARPVFVGACPAAHPVRGVCATLCADEDLDALLNADGVRGRTTACC